MLFRSVLCLPFVILQENSRTQPQFPTALTRTYWNRGGIPAFFLTSPLPTVPSPMGHDHKQQRDLFGDLGSICRWRCSEHHLLKAESTTSFSSFHIPFWTYLSSCQHDYYFLSSCLYSHVSMIILPSPPCNYAYSYVSSLLTLIDIASSAAPSLCGAL